MSRTPLPIVCCAPLTASLLTAEEAEATATLFRALGDPARVRILNVLSTSGGPVCVCELIEPLGLAQPTVSHHLKKLVDAGLLDREQRGKWAYFTINPEAVERLAGLLDLDAVWRQPTLAVTAMSKGQSPGHGPTEER